MTQTVELGGSQQVTKQSRYIRIGALEATLCDKCLEELIRRSRQFTVRIFSAVVAVMGLSAIAAFAGNDLIGSIAAIVGCISVVLLFSTLKTLWEARKVTDTEAKREALDLYVWPEKLRAEAMARQGENPHDLFHPDSVLASEGLGKLLLDEPGKKAYLTDTGELTYRYAIGFENDPSWLASLP